MGFGDEAEKIGMQRVDEGWIVGGFERAYEASIVIDEAQNTSLITICTLPSAISKESLTLTGCFDPSVPSCLFSTPNPNVVGVCQKGQLFAFDVQDIRRDIAFEIMPVRDVAIDTNGGRMFFATDLDITAFDGFTTLWKSRRVSLDGISGLSYSDGLISGFATDVGVDSVAFSIVADTGIADGGFTGFRFV